MNVLITGGSGFLGNQLARALLRTGVLRLAPGDEEPITSLTLFDRFFADTSSSATHVAIACGDIGNPVDVATLIRPDTRVVFHLAAMVSGNGEIDFEGCIRTNLDGTRNVLEACRGRRSDIRVILASSVAVFGGHTLVDTVGDKTKAIPQTTYGMTKLVGELLVNEYSRKGYIDGRTARLPTVFIRPGKPNAAASSFASGVFREPLNDQPCYLPVSRDVKVPLLGYRRVVGNLIKLAECDAALLGTDRAVTFPSTSWPLHQLIEALTNFAARERIPLGPIIDAPDANIAAIVRTWPVATDCSRVRALRLESDESVEQVIREFVSDFPLPARRPISHARR